MSDERIKIKASDINDYDKYELDECRDAKDSYFEEITGTKVKQRLYEHFDTTCDHEEWAYKNEVKICIFDLSRFEKALMYWYYCYDDGWIKFVRKGEPFFTIGVPPANIRNRKNR